MEKTPRFNDAAKWRVAFPYQVEITDFASRVAGRGKGQVESLHERYGGASWCDHVGARTFGFERPEQAKAFHEAEGGTRL